MKSGTGGFRSYATRVTALRKVYEFVKWGKVLLFERVKKGSHGAFRTPQELRASQGSRY